MFLHFVSRLSHRSVTRAIAGFAAGLTLAVAPAATSAAEPYPTQPIRIIVPFGAGGLTDILARLIAEQLSVNEGWQVVVENKTGAGGNIGAAEVARSKPDGHTLLMGSIGTNATNPFMYRNMPYDAAKDFTPITMAASGTLLLVMAPDLPITNMTELVEYARKNPGKLHYASGGMGASQHLAGELLKSMAKIDIEHVPYKGLAPAIPDVISGRVAMTFDMATALPYVKQGKLRAIAVANPQRSSALPDVPTIGETIPGYAASAWYGLFAPAGTPAPVVQQLNTAVTKILNSPAVKEKLLAMGAEASPSTPEEAREFVQAETEKWGKVLKEINIQLD